MNTGDMNIGTFLHWAADGFILLGAIVMTIGVIGIYRMPDIYTKLHAASKAVFLGVFSFLFAIIDTGDAAIIARAILIGLLLILTTPVAAHEIARAAAREEWARTHGVSERAPTMASYDWQKAP